MSRIGVEVMALGLQAGSWVVEQVGDDFWCMLAGSLHAPGCSTGGDYYC